MYRENRKEAKGDSKRVRVNMITRVDKSNIEPFLKLMHEDMAEEIIVGKTLAIGALDNDTAAGIAVFYDETFPDEGGSVVRIKWLFVHPDHRRKGIGDEIMGQLILISDDAGADGVTVSFDEEIPLVKDFLEKWGFSFAGGLGKEIALNFKDIKNYKSSLTSSEKISALSYIDEIHAHELIRKYLRKSGYTGFLLEEGLPKGYIDFEVSGFWGSRENPTGLVLIHCSKEGKLIVEFLVCDGRESFKEIELLRFVCLKAMCKYSQDTLLIVKPDTNEFIMDLDAEHLFKNYLMLNLTEAIILREDWEELIDS